MADKLGAKYVGISDKELMIDYINNKDSETARQRVRLHIGSIDITPQLLYIL